MKRNPTKQIPEAVKEYLRLTDTGQLVWMASHGNARKGDIAGCINGNGYRQLRFEGKIYLAHRVAYFLEHGHCPSCLDHIDGNRLNNRPSNLREADGYQNGRNKGLAKNNTSGVKGVAGYKGRWKASIKVKGETFFLGYHDTKEEAIAARKQAELETGCEFWRDIET